MDAIEFQTTVKDATITIPEEYRDKMKGNVRVILLPEKHVAKGLDMIEHLLCNPLNIEGFEPFTREEVYERR
ncbi:MAG: hypothetical protein ACREDR_21905 [Blastocatellia bacterium]